MSVTWYLEGFADESQRVRRIPLLTFPFRIGRRPGLELTLPSNQVSLEHAEFVRDGDALAIRDLGSTNGTFLNQRRLSGKAPLGDGDIVHFARLEFRVGLMEPVPTTDVFDETVAVDADLPRLVIERSRSLRELLTAGSVETALQPIVELDSRRTAGYEVLGRGGLSGLPTATAELFETATYLGAEIELSRLFRRASVGACRAAGGSDPFFQNTHPHELGDPPGLADSLRELRREAPDLRFVLEVHEKAVADRRQMRELRSLLDDLGMGLAYDDFGAGQARLVELVEVPPDYLKFDISLVRGIDAAPGSQHKLVESLVRMAHDLGIIAIAEGLETEAETAACLDLGFTHGQGYVLGEPSSDSAPAPAARDDA